MRRDRDGRVVYRWHTGIDPVVAATEAAMILLPLLFAAYVFAAWVGIF